MSGPTPHRLGFCLTRGRAKRWWVVWAGLAVLTLAWANNLQGLNNCLQQAPGGHDILDLEFSGLRGNTDDIIFDWQSTVQCEGLTPMALGVARQSIHRDWGFIVCYVALSWVFVGAATRAARIGRRRSRQLMATVLAAGLLDVIENMLLTVYVLDRAPTPDTTAALIAAIASVLKFALLAGALLLSVLLLIRGVRACMRGR